MFLETNDIEFDDIIIAFTNENGRSVEIEYSVDLVLLINK